MELRSKECIDAVLESLTAHVNIKINGSFRYKDYLILRHALRHLNAHENREI